MLQIETLLTQMRLHGMSRAWRGLLETRKHQELSMTEGLELLLQSEQDDREQRRYLRLKKNAHFRYQASIEQLDYGPKRGLDKSLITRLATGDYLTRGESILITGATGCGKSYLATALGHQACHQGMKVAYFNTHKLLTRCALSRVDGTFIKYFEKVSKMDVIILDDFGLTPINAQQQLDLMEIIEDRHAKKSTIIASQLPVSHWFDVIQDATIADAILDRLTHTAHRIELKGDSLRKKM